MTDVGHDVEIRSIAGATIERVDIRNDWVVLVLRDGREAVIDWRSFIITYPVRGEPTDVNDE